MPYNLRPDLLEGLPGVRGLRNDFRGGKPLVCLFFVRAFLDNVAAYPTGTLVKLNTGEIGVVLEKKKGYSLYLKVRILFAASGEPLLGREEVCLAEQERLFVSEVIEAYGILRAAIRENEAK
ncbi:MAG: hypothetical protein AB1523_10490 [Bacillota bacterium]